MIQIDGEGRVREHGPCEAQGGHDDGRSGRGHQQNGTSNLASLVARLPKSDVYIVSLVNATGLCDSTSSSSWDPVVC